jgi:hypothetical protein
MMMIMSAKDRKEIENELLALYTLNLILFSGSERMKMKSLPRL